MSPGRAPAYNAANWCEMSCELPGETFSLLALEAIASLLTLILNEDWNLNGLVANHASMMSLNELSPPGLSRRSMTRLFAPAARKLRKAESMKLRNRPLSYSFTAAGSVL